MIDMQPSSRLEEARVRDKVKTSFDRQGQVIENAAHRVTSEVAQALEGRRSARIAELALAEELDRTPEMRREAAERRVRGSRTRDGPGVYLEELGKDLREAALRRSEQISTILKDRVTRRERLVATEAPKWVDQVAAQPVDHSFWWSQTQPHLAPGTWCDFRDDGLHFWGGPKVNDYDGEMHTSFGAVASFGLAPARFPTSPNGWLTSNPWVELFGGVVAYAPDWDLFQGNGIASCNLFLRQTLFQWAFGPTGPVPRKIAEAQGNDAWHVYLKNTGYSRHLDLPGWKPIPPVNYHQSQLAPNDLWAEVEVRFDIYLNCTGALLWCDPEALLRTFQWAPTALP